ncbi:MAG: phosphotransferase family protein, partial [Burkholderiaceae bacterium]
MPVSERQQFDVGDLQDFLRDKLPGFTGPLTVEQFKGGQSNPTFKLTDPNGAWVMRCKPAPADKLLKSAHAIDREYKVLDALADTDVPVAKVFVLCEDESVIGRAFYIMECVEGRILWEQSLPNMAKRERAAIYEEMNRVIANLHLLDYNKIGLGDFGRPGNYFARQIDRWTKQYRITETQKIPAMDNLIDWLPQNIPEGDETSIVHGDYRL